MGILLVSGAVMGVVSVTWILTDQAFRLTWQAGVDQATIEQIALSRDQGVYRPKLSMQPLWDVEGDWRSKKKPASRGGHEQSSRV